MQATPEARLTTSSKPMFVLAVLIASALIPTNTLMAQKAVTPPMAEETITPVTTKDLAVFPGEQALMYTVDFPRGDPPSQCEQPCYWRKTYPRQDRKSTRLNSSHRR